jgi:hypothetical protein
MSVDACCMIIKCVGNLPTVALSTKNTFDEMSVAAAQLRTYEIQKLSPERLLLLAQGDCHLQVNECENGKPPSY